MPQIRTIPQSGSVPTTNQLPLGDIAINTYDGKAYIKQFSGSTQNIIQLGAGGGVTQIIAGTNVTLSPTTGVGAVTINAIAGGGGSGTPNGPLYSLQFNNGGLFSGSENFTLLNNNTLYLTGSLKVSGSITSSLFGTSSWANNSLNSLTASYVVTAQTASFVQIAQTASYVLNAISSSYNLSSSYSLSSSYAEQAKNTSTININSFGSPVESYLLMSNVVATTGVGIGGDTELRYNSSTNVLTVPSITSSFSGSLLGTASFASTASYWSGSITNSISASYALTASYVLNAISSSFATTSSYWSGSIINSLSSSFATTASFVQTAQTASYILNAVSSSYSLSSSFALSSSRAVSSSYALSASYAPDTTFPYTGSAGISGSLSVTNNITASIVSATNNSNGTNFRVGDDVWIGDINVANTMQVMGQQNADQGYIKFGNGVSNPILGANNSSTLSLTGALTTTSTINNVTLDNNAWASYGVIWSSDGVPPSLGNGTLEGYYRQIGKTVFVRVKLLFGTTTNGGTGTWYFSLPVNAAVAHGIQFPCSILNDGAAWYQGTVNGVYGGFIDKTAIIGQSAGGANSSQSITGVFPFTFGNLDSLQFNGSYEAL